MGEETQALARSLVIAANSKLSSPHHKGLSSQFPHLLMHFELFGFNSFYTALTPIMCERAYHNMQVEVPGQLKE